MPAGVIKACLRKDDFISSTYRDHVHALSKGVSARKIMSELFGKKTGCCRGQGGSMHMFDREHGLVSGCWGVLGWRWGVLAEVEEQGVG